MKVKHMKTKLLMAAAAASLISLTACGTNPTNAASFLQLDISLPNSQPAVVFGAESNKTYTVQFNDDLSTSSWLKLADIFARTNSRVEMIPDPSATTNRFYRVVTPRQP